MLLWISLLTACRGSLSNSLSFSLLSLFLCSSSTWIVLSLSSVISQDWLKTRRQTVWFMGGLRICYARLRFFLLFLLLLSSIPNFHVPDSSGDTYYQLSSLPKREGRRGRPPSSASTHTHSDAACCGVVKPVLRVSVPSLVAFVCMWESVAYSPNDQDIINIANVSHGQHLSFTKREERKSNKCFHNISISGKKSAGKQTSSVAGISWRDDERYISISPTPHVLMSQATGVLSHPVAFSFFQ